MMNKACGHVVKGADIRWSKMLTDRTSRDGMSGSGRQDRRQKDKSGKLTGKLDRDWHSGVTHGQGWRRPSYSNVLVTANDDNDVNIFSYTSRYEVCKFIGIFSECVWFSWKWCECGSKTITIVHVFPLQRFCPLDSWFSYISLHFRRNCVAWNLAGLHHKTSFSSSVSDWVRKSLSSN